MRRLRRAVPATPTPKSTELAPPQNLVRLLEAYTWSPEEITEWSRLYRRRLHVPYEAYYAILDSYTELSMNLLQRAQAPNSSVAAVTSRVHEYFDTFQPNDLAPTEMDILNCKQLHDPELLAQAREIRSLTTEVTIEDGTPCPRPTCRSTNTSVVLVRMNGSDEPMTNMFRCYTCNYQWRN